jgi:hypothetical protein
MEFEPVIAPLFESRIQIDLNPFLAVHANTFDKSLVRHLTSRLLAALQLFYKSSENNLMDCLSLAAGFVENSRSADDFWVHREGGSK